MRFLSKNLMLASLLGFSLASEEESQGQQLQRQLQVAARVVSKTSNLGLCEGDCNSNANCKSGLVCWQRNAGDIAPGCSLSSTLLKSRTDFCVARPGGTPTAPARAPTAPAAPVRAPPTSSGGTTATYVGNDGVSNLGMCQGDCDRDGDCASGLRCHQRSRGQGAPGCNLGNTMLNSDNDFCVANSGGTPTPPAPVVAPVVAPVRPTPSGSSFRLKMYWEAGYDWQNEPFERKWCLACRGGCSANNGEIQIKDCDSSPTRWEFVSYGPNEVQIKVANENICVEEFADNDLELSTCDSSNQKQRFVAFGGSFSDRRFEISPKQRQGWCATQRHHPRADESVNLEPCVTARRDGSNTSYWNKY